LIQISHSNYQQADETSDQPPESTSDPLTYATTATQ